MLLLDSRKPFTIGGTRRCYIHPEYLDRCVKVLRPDRIPEVRRQQAQGWQRFRRLRAFDDQFKEICAYNELVARNRPSTWEHVPRYFGTVDTDLGLGVVTELIRDFDGELPLNLEELTPRLAAATLVPAIESFELWLRDELFLSRNLLPHNILAVRNAPEKFRLVIVDGIGNNEWLPISSWFDYFAVRKIERRIYYFEQRLQILNRDLG